MDAVSRAGITARSEKREVRREWRGRKNGWVAKGRYDGEERGERSEEAGRDECTRAGTRWNSSDQWSVVRGGGAGGSPQMSFEGYCPTITGSPV